VILIVWRQYVDGGLYFKILPLRVTAYDKTASKMRPLARTGTNPLDGFMEAKV
jgi:hypothetical protein